ncbi:coil containing protein [Vibrio phage 1.238.A._10N.261.52.F10]|uniref:Coil containing protein n=1 Tax=Vibrio phage 1.238.A._10N.261.52.F10 TaxID=1881231 RepID=A0A2I7RUG0_9CAUD|nr:coil containing protein [Vibrio phage 1.238.A._10N.261.52.F10]AUR97287.1 coil containing protein [Vibrio phage 1.238.A._10N.261.52.F10]AUR97381.1 coil containing protein [Vibrio phage 1.238.B._10N.261.52.F10]
MVNNIYNTYGTTPTEHWQSIFKDYSALPMNQVTSGPTQMFNVAPMTLQNQPTFSGQPDVFNGNFSTVENMPSNVRSSGKVFDPRMMQQNLNFGDSSMSLEEAIGRRAVLNGENPQELSVDTVTGSDVTAPMLTGVPAVQPSVQTPMQSPVLEMPTLNQPNIAFDMFAPTQNTGIGSGINLDAGTSMGSGITLDVNGGISNMPVNQNPSGGSWMDMFGLGDMSSKDIYSGLAATAQLGLGAYGMFTGLDQMDTRLDQSQQSIDLQRDEYEENLRHRRAITEQNKRA